MSSILAIAAISLSVGSADLHPLLASPPQNAWFMLDSTSERDATWAVCIRLKTQDDATRVADLVPSLGGIVRSRLLTVPMLTCEIPHNMFTTIASLPGMLWIEPASPPLTPCMDNALPNSHIDILHASPWNLTGNGQRITLIEPGIPNVDHIDLVGRVETFSSGGTADHATHVCGILAGDGTESGGKWTGAAPNVIVDAQAITQVDDYFFYSDAGNLEAIYEEELKHRQPIAVNQSLGSNIQQNGYPCSLHGDYGVTAELLDGIVRGSLGMPISSVWAAGNERAYNTCGYEFGTIGQPATAKNVIAVGAVYSDTNITAIFSSFGPTDDGRIKPDLVAPGTQLSDDFGITACARNGGYETMSGTSMATPIVTGTLALLGEAQKLAWPNEATPLPSTWRAILCHTAEDIGQTGPDYQSGWGLLNAEAAAAVVIAHDWTESTMSSGGVNNYAIESTSEPILVTLAWDDMPALAGATETLIHDLDIIVLAPDGTTHHPWTLNPANPTQAATQNSSDHINTIEQILIDSPIPGIYQVFVIGESIADPAGQAYSLVSSPPMARTLLKVMNSPANGVHWSATDIEVDITPVGESIIDGSARLIYSVDNADPNSTPLAIQPNGLWFGSLPPAGCGSIINWWIEVESTLTGVSRMPLSAPGSTFSLPIGDNTSVLFSESFEQISGWTATSTANDGLWQRAEPNSYCEDRGEPTSDAEVDSTFCFLTELGNSNNCLDVDNGCTWLVSPPMNATHEELMLSYSRWFSNSGCGHNFDDSFLVEFSTDDGENWQDLEIIPDNSDEADGGWYTVSWDVASLDGFTPTDAFRLRFTACDDGASSCVEAAIDAVTLIAPPCITLCREDIAEANGQIDVTDLLKLIKAYGTDDPAADFDQNGDVSIDDLLTLVAAWGPCGPL